MNLQHMPAVLTAILISICSQTALGVGGDSDYSSSAQKPAGYNEAIALIAAEKYKEAILHLQSAEESAQNDADIQNLLGLTHRKTGRLDAAAGYYRRALAINPEHKGALEYQGELFLMLGDRDAATANLAKLNEICWLGCTEFDELKKAITSSQ